MLGYLLAACSSSLALNTAITENCMLLCPPHKITSPKRTLSSVTVALKEGIREG